MDDRTTSTGLRSNIDNDMLDATDRATLAEAASLLWPKRCAIADAWSRRTLAALPPTSRELLPLDTLRSVNESFLVLVFEHLCAGDLNTLYDLYYERSRALIEADLRLNRDGRLTLDGLYQSARTSAQVLNEYLDGQAVAQLAYAKLFTQLMMIVGIAYSDCREEHLRGTLDEVRQSREQFDLLCTLAKKIAEAADLAAAMQHVLEEICRTTGWGIGEAWMPSPGTSELRCTWTWCEPRTEFREFCNLSQGQTLVRGDGLPGKAYSTRAAVWMENVANSDDFIRRDAAIRAGIKAAVALPVIADGEVVAALAFFLPEARDEDARLVTIISSAAAQLGSFLRRREAEQALENSRGELEQRVLERTSELARSNAIKTGFAATMSHELRNSLEIIHGFSEILLGDDGDSLSEEKRSLLSTIRRQSFDSAELIRAILELAHGESKEGGRHVTKIELADFVESLKTTITVPEDKQHIALEYYVAGDLPSVRADATKLAMILRNLIRNALKFTGSGAVTVSVRQSGGQILLEVADTGVGIPTDEIPALFDPFRQAHGIASRAAGGAGLGLYIVRRLIDQIGGSIEVESEERSGTTFRIQLQAVESAAA